MSSAGVLIEDKSIRLRSSPPNHLERKAAASVLDSPLPLYRFGPLFMTWTETFHCEICGKQKGSVDHWWLAWNESYRPPYPDAVELPILKVYPWENMSAHDADVKHLCGQACLQTLVARWMNRTISVEHRSKASA